MKDEMRQKRDEHRNKAEARIQTDYELIFPSEDFNKEKYQHFFDAAKESYNEFN